MIRQGLIPTLLGTAVTGVGFSSSTRKKRTKDIAPMICCWSCGLWISSYSIRKHRPDSREDRYSKEG